MTRTCRLCRRPAARDDCYVRLQREDHPACRACWEQLFLDPRRVLRSLAGTGGAPPAGASGTRN